MKLLRQKLHHPSQSGVQLDFFSVDPLIDDATPRKKNLDHSPVKHFQQPLRPSSPLLPSKLIDAANHKRRIQIGHHELDYTLLRSNRRSIGFLITDEGLRITAPKWITLAEIDNAIRDKQRWIFSKLTERRERSARRLQPDMQWRDGATLPYLGEEITLRITAAQNIGVIYEEANRELLICLPAEATEQQLKDRVQGWLQSQARQMFAERLPIYAKKLGVAYHSFALSSATTQWGSCTVDGKIRLNWRLMHFALPLIDYVIAHELAHLREMNHSPRFWATVQSIFPEFQAAKKELRERAPETLPIF